MSDVVRLEVADEAGVLAAVAGAFAEQGVSIESMLQRVRRSEDGDASLHIVTHAAPDAALAATVRRLHDLTEVARIASVVRVEGA